MRQDLIEVLVALDACAAREEDAVPWAKRGAYGTDYERALAECPNWEWLTWLADKLGMTHGLARCACAYARARWDERSSVEKRCVETVEEWLEGGSRDRVRTALDAAYTERSRSMGYCVAACVLYEIHAFSYAENAARKSGLSNDQLLAITQRVLGAELIENLTE